MKYSGRHTVFREISSLSIRTYNIKGRQYQDLVYQSFPFMEVKIKEQYIGHEDVSFPRIFER
jgi:hypothetical protein